MHGGHWTCPRQPADTSVVPVGGCTRGLSRINRLGDIFSKEEHKEAAYKQRKVIAQRRIESREGCESACAIGYGYGLLLSESAFSVTAPLQSKSYPEIQPHDDSFGNACSEVCRWRKSEQGNQNHAEMYLPARV